MAKTAMSASREAPTQISAFRARARPCGARAMTVPPVASNATTAMEKEGPTGDGLESSIRENTA